MISAFQDLGPSELSLLSGDLGLVSSDLGLVSSDLGPRVAIHK